MPNPRQSFASQPPPTQPPPTQSPPTRTSAQTYRASDADVIRTWQLLRNTVSAIDGDLATATDLGDRPGVFYEALTELAQAPQQMLPMSDLAGTVGLTSGGLTKLVDRLVRDGLVTRRHSTTDRRVVYAVLTTRGAAHELRSTHLCAEQLRTSFDAFTPTGLHGIRDVCREIRRRLHDLHGRPLNGHAHRYARPASGGGSRG